MNLVFEAMQQPLFQEIDRFVQTRRRGVSPDHGAIDIEHRFRGGGA